MEFDLEFEQDLAEAARSIRAMHQEARDEAAHRRLQETMHRLQAQTKEIYARLSAWQTVQVARHKDRPYAADYIQMMSDDFLELHGDRAFGDDHAIMTGFGKLA